MANAPQNARSSIWRRRLSEFASVAVFASCVALVANHTRGLSEKADTGDYADSVRRSIDGAPREFKSWVGVDVPIPAQAEALLRPTAMLSRHYVNRATGESCILMIVHCGDARDMLDHYPPNCYPGQGWELRAADPIDIPTTFGTILATEYEFSRGRFGTSTDARVINSMLLPDGTSDRTMGGIERVMGNSSLRFFGVGQIQVFFDSAIAPQRRRDIAIEMLEAHREAVLSVMRMTDRLQADGKR